MSRRKIQGGGQRARNPKLDWLGCKFRKEIRNKVQQVFLMRRQVNSFFEEDANFDKYRIIRPNTTLDVVEKMN